MDTSNINWSGSHLCLGTHVFLWDAGSSNSEVPEGTPCTCGMFIAHYDTCDKCGTKKLTYIPRQKADEYINQLQRITNALRQIEADMKAHVENDRNPFSEASKRMDSEIFHLSTIIGDLRTLQGDHNG